MTDATFLPPSAYDLPEELPADACYTYVALATADEPLTQAELAKRTFYNQPTISRALDYLDKHDLIERVPSASDGEGRPPTRYSLR